jgi:hypothetical protein
MSETIEPTIEEIPGERLSWSRVWFNVLTRPSTKTFEQILRDPQASPRRAYWWVFTSAIIGTVIQSVLFRLVFKAGFEELGLQPTPLICVPVVAAMAVLGIAINAGITQGAAGRLFGGKGTYGSLIYALAAWVAPIYLISSLIAGIPYFQCFTIPLSIYGLVLGVIAVKAVNQFGWAQAVVSYIVVYVLVVMVVAGITICVVLFFGPSFIDQWESIMQGTPVP